MVRDKSISSGWLWVAINKSEGFGSLWIAIDYREIARENRTVGIILTCRSEHARGVHA